MAGDVIELILADHRKFEELLRSTPDVSDDRRAARDELSDLLVAHAEAEEEEVYPSLRYKTPSNVKKPGIPEKATPRATKRCYGSSR